MTSSPDLLPGVSARSVETPRLQTYVLESGSATGIPVVFVHGNVSSSRFFESTLAVLDPKYHGLAPDLRGYGNSQPAPIDATRGMRDFSDDLFSLVSTALGPQPRIHFVGWSMGAGVIMQYTIDHPETVASLTLISPASPFGFGGTKDTAGTLCWPDAAGSGGAAANPEFVQLLRSGDRSDSSPNSPRNVLNAFYFKPPFRAAPEREEIFVDEMLKTRVGDDFYPGDSTPSANWPMVAPGTRGINNSFAPIFCNLSAFAGVTPQPPVLWVRGTDDQIISDASFLDFGTLGKLGFVPGWPGDATFPSQPMVSQMRAVLDAYQASGGRYQEVVIADCGHSPLIEKPAEFRAAFFNFLSNSRV
ncbi:MAG: alpha/beta hydrolase [Ktedonobacterales bacterium]